MSPRRWLLADQLGPHFVDDDQPVLLVEAKALFRQRPLHRQKAHLILSAIRHRAAELGERALLLRTETFRQALSQVTGAIEVCHPPSRAALRFARSVEGLSILPPRGFMTSFDEFAQWADGNRRGPLRMAAFYRDARRRHDVLLGTLDAPPPSANRPAPPPSDRRIPPVPEIEEDDIDAEVRRDLDRWTAEGIRFIGRDGPRRYPATHAEADARLQHFLRHRLAGYTRQVPMSTQDHVLAHSQLSSSFNLGLLDPAPAVRAAEAAGRTGNVPPAAVASFVRQLLGWREFLWQLYWYFDPAYRSPNWLIANEPIPDWFLNLEADALQAHCMSDALGAVRDRAWAHHAQRLLLLGNYGLQRGWRPAELADWFQRAFVDGADWVMNATVIGMSQYADLARIDTRPYAVSGVQIDDGSDYCGNCCYDPVRDLGEGACPYTAGIAAFYQRNRARLGGDARLLEHVTSDVTDKDRLDAIAAQEAKRASTAP
ncbi:cryptochrome/photolyase family protein [Micromonospora sp. CPCC 205539]|uniref:cryptochrome/photolyase family protein n=1 Tax=Micromonospora sp. CPCC 205539 TaxID=3122408 RepID=UPI002FF1F3A8